MKQENKRKILSLSLMLAMTLTNCATQIANNIPVKSSNSNYVSQNNVIVNNSINSISGRVNFDTPALSR
ncbi:MAG: hypothetical protein H7263_00815, partial [Candidatus Sericytochromatia bacterium]|nr:hypothetical protein [Candidatus Sericytochromatia bacterium]